MIDSLRGTLLRKEPMSIVVDVQGVGYLVHISLQSFDGLPAIGDGVEILTVLHVREDLMQLFGFLTDAERNMFRLLQSISGIGPKVALGILSGCGADQLREYVRMGNVGALTAIPGIGRKTAERIIVELKDKLARSSAPDSVPGSTPASDRRGEALMALLALGYSRASAEQALLKAVQSAPAEPDVSALIKLALKVLSG
jgi:holliday junction DNA helicase RuvA